MHQQPHLHQGQKIKLMWVMSFNFANNAHIIAKSQTTSAISDTKCDKKVSPVSYTHLTLPTNREV